MLSDAEVQLETRKKQTIAPLITRLEAVDRVVQQYYHELKSQVSHFDDVDLVDRFTLFTRFFSKLKHFSPVFSKN